MDQAVEPTDTVICVVGCTPRAGTGGIVKAADCLELAGEIVGKIQSFFGDGVSAADTLLLYGRCPIQVVVTVDIVKVVRPVNFCPQVSTIACRVVCAGILDA